jgi:tellurite resistance protein
MEGIFIIVLIWIFIAVIKAIVSSNTGSSSGSSSGVHMDSFQVRLVNGRLGEDNDGLFVKEVEGKGLFPIRRTTNIGFFTSVFDSTSGELKPILSVIENFQETDSIVYQHRVDSGRTEPNQGYIDWVKLGVVIPEILQPPHSGKRNLDVFIRMVDMDNLPDITHGFSEPDHPGVLWVQKLSFNYDFTEKGYEEETEHRDEAMGITAKIGIAVAMADGSLDDREGKVINAWVVRNIEPYSDEKKKHLKKVYNDAMKEAFTAAKNGDLSLSTLTSRLNEISEKSARYETIELCFDVMAADGVADAEELKTIRKIAEALDLDLDEIEKMRDQKIIGFNTDSSGQASIEDLLGIETHWDKDQIKKHLRTEFQKWNNRLNTLSEGRERENAQRMLDLIADARRNYA